MDWAAHWTQPSSAHRAQPALSPFYLFSCCLFCQKYRRRPCLYAAYALCHPLPIAEVEAEAYYEIL
jgi:hypothetical protein